MDPKLFGTMVSNIEVGKSLPDAVYVHHSALDSEQEELRHLVIAIGTAVKLRPDEWNIVKLYKRDYKISFLLYPDFDSYPYPSLASSHTVDLSKLQVRKADYTKSMNPPILHRRESFVGTNHPRYQEYRSYTTEGESIGLYENTRKIGFKNSWERLIARKGYALDESGALVKKFDVTPRQEQVSDVTIERYRTAIDRNQLSQPMQCLARHDYLNGEFSIFDYGCGKGDDLRELEAHGLDAKGWDPNFLPEADKEPSDIVNLGFVLNVIEDRKERDETLRMAWELTEKILVVSVMVAGESVISQFRPYKDGVVTKTNTFQKYYAQSEIRLYIETVLEQNAIAVGSGIFFVFRDPLDEQEFLLKRHKVVRSWDYKTRKSTAKKSAKISEAKFLEHQELFTSFWKASLDLGRIPSNDEFELSEEIKELAGSHASAHQALKNFFNKDEFELAAQKRKDDLLVYFTMGLFEKRKPYSRLPLGLQRDIKAFFQSHSLALDHARELLFSVGDPELISRECNEYFSRTGSGLMEEDHSLTVHESKITQMSPVLRTYVGCATTLYGDLEDVDLVKIHMTSGKVTFLEYDDWKNEHPKLIYRIKVRMRDQDFDIFDHSNSEQRVVDKSALI